MLGLGILKGLKVTLQHFLETYIYDVPKFPRRYRADGHFQRLKAWQRGLFTVQYPEERLKMFPRFRGALMQLRDPQMGEVRCTACEICIRACPHGCLSVEGEGKGKERKPVSYTWDAGSCMFCGLCVEACPFGAIAMGPEYELASSSRDLVYHLDQLLALGDKHAPTGVYPVEAEKGA